LENRISTPNGNGSSTTRPVMRATRRVTVSGELVGIVKMMNHLHKTCPGANRIAGKIKRQDDSKAH
jgi:hypothetical protein